MICTPGQLTSMLHWGTGRHGVYLNDAEHVGKRRRVVMPYTGWVSLADLLRQEAFTKWGKGRPGKLVGDAHGTRSALHCIESYTVALRQHPALQGFAVVGCSEQLLCVWPTKTWSVSRDWALMPQPGESMVVLYPEYMPVRGARSGEAAFRTDLTVWHEKEWDDEFLAYDLLPEVEHLGW